jgi:hypothetical protein
MKKLLPAATLLAVAIGFSPVVFSADSGEAFKECKSEAEKNEVDSADFKNFVANCMAELDIAAADIKSLLEPENSTGGQESAKDE